MIRKGNTEVEPALAFAENKDGDIYAAIDKYGSFIRLPYIEKNPYSSKRIANQYDFWAQRGTKQYHVIDVFSNAAKIYYVKLTNYIIGRGDKNDSVERRIAKQGIILQGDNNFYLELAKANRERYRKEVEAIKAKKNDKSKTFDAFNDLFTECVDLAKDVAANPEKYKSHLYEFSDVVESMSKITRQMGNVASSIARTANKERWTSIKEVDNYAKMLDNAVVGFKKQIEGIRAAVAA